MFVLIRLSGLAHIVVGLAICVCVCVCVGGLQGNQSFLWPT